MTYEVNIPSARVTLHNPAGNEAIGCFWLERDDPRVLAFVTERVAVVGNIYHDKFIKERPYKMALSGHKIARALWCNPQIHYLRLVTSDRDELDSIVPELRKHGQLLATYEDGALAGSYYEGTNSVVIALRRDRVKVDYPLPEVKEPTTYPYKYESGHVVRGTDLTKMHADLLRHALRYGALTGGDEPRYELRGTYAEWRSPFKLGKAYEALEDTWDEYAHLLPEDGANPPDTPEDALEYTYFSRLSLPFNARVCDQAGRRGFFPVWLPGDHNHRHPPCLVSIYVHNGVATGTFRAHNFVNAWPKNFYLVKTLAEEKCNGPLKAVVLISLQGGIRPEDADQARKYIEEYHSEGRPDIHGTGGSWVFHASGDEGIAHIIHNDAIVAEFRGKSSLEIRTKITAAGAWPAEYSECAFIGDELRGLFHAGTAKTGEQT